MVKNLVGPPVVGEDFVGRKEELAEAVRMISQGNSLLLASPRRVGKSSFSKKLVEMFRREGVLAAYVDLQGVRTEQELGFLLALYLSQKGLGKLEERSLIRKHTVFPTNKI